jgi:hypothetical protein
MEVRLPLRLLHFSITYYTNITENKYCELVITQGTSTITKYFSIVINPGTISAALPGGMEDGINYNLSDPYQSNLSTQCTFKRFCIRSR